MGRRSPDATMRPSQRRVDFLSLALYTATPSGLQCSTMRVPLDRPVRVSFDLGTIVVEPQGRGLASVAELRLVYDGRIKALRGDASRYRFLVEWLVANDIPFIDEAVEYERLTTLVPQAKFSPYKHQEEALAAWKEAGMAGVVVLPTGSGKTYLAMLAMHECRRATLVVVPTLDLLAQWVGVVKQTFGCPVGMVGGGEFTVEPITITTYDSAVRHMDRFGNRFGLLIYDECHHLPGEMYSETARMSLAPFRLGLSATPDRADGGEVLLKGLIGETVYESRVSALAGHILAPYETVRIPVALAPEEEERYLSAREVYLAFCRRKGLRMGSGGGWSNFLQETARSKEGRRAFEAYRIQRNIPLMSEGKFAALAQILIRHQASRTLIFTHVNELAYRISRDYLIPVITHQTPPRERSEILAKFSSGEYPSVVTSKVLNEGVDVPEANVAVVLSGSGSIREHVQRLGRILRRREGKQAVLYELVAQDTHEEGMSKRRTRHEAYRGKGRRRG